MADLPGRTLAFDNVRDTILNGFCLPIPEALHGVDALPAPELSEKSRTRTE